MFLIQTGLSIITLVAMYLLSHQHRYAPTLGLLVNAAWVTMWVSTGQYGFLFLDAGITIVYFKTLVRQLKGDWGHV